VVAFVKSMATKPCSERRGVGAPEGWVPPRHRCRLPDRNVDSLLVCRSGPVRAGTSRPSSSSGTYGTSDGGTGVCASNSVRTELRSHRRAPRSGPRS
jgi:hypothetical protein